MAVKPSRARAAASAARTTAAGAKPARFVVAFSGGLDSTVLLHVAAALFGPQALLAVHVNHHLQDAAALFEAHASETCKAWGIELRVCHLEDAPAKGESMEAWAREERYRALHRVAAEQGAAIVMTAHHQDDQVESLLIALSRGAGLDGLRGIAAGRDLAPHLPGIQLHRPLLACSRQEIEDHARIFGLHWVEDPSNQQHQFLRNRIRAELLPVIRRVLPGFDRQATRSMAHVAAAARLSAPALGPGAEVLSLASLSAEDETGRALLLRQWLRAMGLRAPSQARLSALMGQLLGGTPSLRFELGKVCVRKERGLCWIEGAGQHSNEAVPGGETGKPSSDAGSRSGPEISSEPTDVAPLGALQASARGWTWHLPAFKGLLLIERRAGKGKPHPGEEFALRALQVVPARSSQKMLLDEARPRRTLKNLFQEAGIPAGLRSRLPSVQRGDEVLFVAGLGTAPASPWTFHFLPDL